MTAIVSKITWNEDNSIYSIATRRLRDGVYPLAEEARMGVCGSRAIVVGKEGQILGYTAEGGRSIEIKTRTGNHELTIKARAVKG